MSSSKKAMMKPCCRKFDQFAMRYQDIVCQDDYRLRMIANLLLNIQDLECFDVESLEEIAHTIDEYINRKIVREHYFFGRTLRSCTFDSVELGAEIHRVHARIKKSENIES